ncbi:hypothetical protein EG359_00730 [Chryseobacterium joostei]|uniref:Uncharacterized protein n=1 Tax=Chryseobacterium joostei TaxID=112234 RepID=A0ABM7BGR2_9FLAO|nr:hypothetical protein EG359_00730 [Chryseobacterium joostei]HCM35635.1 hypothetical protein [Chryseobacterium sp.]
MIAGVLFAGTQLDKGIGVFEFERIKSLIGKYKPTSSSAVRESDRNGLLKKNRYAKSTSSFCKHSVFRQ